MSITEVVCPRCGTVRGPDDNKFCTNCGLNLAAQFELPSCGECLPDTLK